MAWIELDRLRIHRCSSSLIKSPRDRAKKDEFSILWINYESN